MRRTASVLGAVLYGLLALVVLCGIVGGTPWALTRFIGWPLPRSLPTLETLQVWLISPLSDDAILDTLACVCWIAWAAFTADLAAATRDQLRGVSVPSRPGLLRAASAGLIGAIVLAALISRTGIVPAAPTAAIAQTPAATSTPNPEPGTCVVRSPEHGIHDSLWRIAERTLGAGHRWPEIYRLNRGQPQTDGRTLTNPDLIHPGWVLRLPTATPPSDPPALAPDSSPREERPSPTSAAPTTVATQPTSIVEQPQFRPGTAAPGFQLGDGVFVGTTLAAVVAAALLGARLYQRHRTRRPAAMPPLVRRLAQLHQNSPDAAGDATAPGELLPGLAAPADIAIGTRDGHELIWNLAHGGGIGLTGPGALPAARALLTTMLGAGGPTHTLDEVAVITTTADGVALFDGYPPSGPARLAITTDLDEAITTAEAELLRRTRILEMIALPTAADVRAQHPVETLSPLVVLATPQQDHAARLQALVDHGRTVAISGLLLGGWPTGITCRVRTDGTIGTAFGPGGQAIGDLTNTRLFHLPAPAARDLLDLLRTAQPHIAVEPVNRGEPDPTDGAQDAADPATDDLAELGRGEPPLLDRADQALPSALRIFCLGGIAASAPHSEGDLLVGLGPKPRLLLGLLCLRPRGLALADALDALWPGVPPDRAAVRFHATLAQLRKALHGQLPDERPAVAYLDTLYHLDETITVDLWDLQTADQTARQPNVTDDQRHAALQRIVTLYPGQLLDRLDADWLEAARESVRRTVLDALLALAREAQHEHPEHALSLLDQAITHDPYAEPLYRHIMRLQARLGRADAVTRTYRLLHARLAELDLEPDPATDALLAELLRRPGSTKPDHHAADDRSTDPSDRPSSDPSSQTGHPPNAPPRSTVAPAPRPVNSAIAVQQHNKPTSGGARGTTTSSKEAG